MDWTPGPVGPDGQPSTLVGLTEDRACRRAMAPLWKSMLSRSSPLYRESLFSFSLWECRVKECELAFLRKQFQKEKKGVQRQMEK